MCLSVTQRAATTQHLHTSHVRCSLTFSFCPSHLPVSCLHEIDLIASHGFIPSRFYSFNRFSVRFEHPLSPDDPAFYSSDVIYFNMSGFAWGILLFRPVVAFSRLKNNTRSRVVSHQPMSTLVFAIL